MLFCCSVVCRNHRQMITLNVIHRVGAIWSQSGATLPSIEPLQQQQFVIEHHCQFVQFVADAFRRGEGETTALDEAFSGERAVKYPFLLLLLLPHLVHSAHTHCPLPFLPACPISMLAGGKVNNAPAALQERVLDAELSISTTISTSTIIIIIVNGIIMAMML